MGDNRTNLVPSGSNQPERRLAWAYPSNRVRGMNRDGVKYLQDDVSSMHQKLVLLHTEGREVKIKIARQYIIHWSWSAIP